MEHSQMEHPPMAHPYRHRNYEQMEYKKDVAVLIKNRRHEYYPEHGSENFDDVRSPNGLIDREKTCPFLLRLFYKLDGEYNDVEDVKLCKKSGVQSNELQIYGWLDITMREIVTLVKDFYQESRKRDAHWVFKVYSNEKKKLTFLSRVHSTKYNYREDNKTLLSLDYDIGDILLLSIMFEGQAA
ncbi:sin3 associated polypeptide p18-like protein, partial [Plasmodium cynomolgi strain B]